VPFVEAARQGIVRVGAPHPDLIARVLDWGRAWRHGAHVNSAAEAETIVQAAHYAPRGRRGFSRTVRAYDYGLTPPGDTPPGPRIMAQIELSKGVKHAGEIAGVDGIDVLFVGPADLQFDLKTARNPPLAITRSVLPPSSPRRKAQARPPGFLCEISLTWVAIVISAYPIAVDSDIAILRKAYQQTLSSLSR